MNAGTEREYGCRGRFGVLVPQANPTVEPEFRRLLPAGAEPYVARLTSRAASPRDRLVEYLDGLPATLAQYDTLRLDAVAFACTGSSYLVGAERDRALFATASAACGTPVLSATGAIAAALAHLGARRLCLVSPYPPWLRDAAVAYWRAGGLEVVRTVDVPIAAADTRGIYALGLEQARAALAGLDARGADAVLLSGTGMPTLPLVGARAAGPPVLSSNACLAWRLRAHLAGGPDPQDTPLRVPAADRPTPEEPR